MSEPAKPFRLYPRAMEPRLDPALLARPTSEYRGMPFWCWNDSLDREQLLRQIDVMRSMGFGGFHIHSRTGLATEYLGETWMNLVAMCADEAERRHMLCWLYDEDRWPSGYAGGLATKELRFRQRHLLWTQIPYGHNAPRGRSDYTTAIRNETGRLVARYLVELDEDYRLSSYRRLGIEESVEAGTAVWYAYIEPSTPSTWFNGQTAIDTLSRDAMQHFIDLTHERYRQKVGDHFGGVIPAFFTDEPQFVKKSMFKTGAESHDLFMPITEDFCDTYRETFSQDLLDHLPELFWNLRDDRPSLARYRYHEHTAERFASAFSDTIGQWCEHHRVALTGHMLGEANLMSQTRGCGEAMRGLRAFQIPGIDILCDKREFTTALQARSVAHQFGRQAVASELYGVTGWHFDFVGHKAQGDWQAALGITVRIPHLFWMSMRGEAKRDYPSSIGEQSPWFQEYGLIEDHFARVATVMTRGAPATKIAVIHPIESAWIHWGPDAQNGEAAKRLEESFTQLPEWLLLGNVDFDYLSESHLARSGAGVERFDAAHMALVVGLMHYSCIVVPPTSTLRASTLDLLEWFAGAGGTVVFAGDVATAVDAVCSDRPARLAANCTHVAFEPQAILHPLRQYSEVDITHADYSRTDSILHQLRIDGDQRHLFLVNTDRASKRSLRIHVAGAWDVTLHNTMAGQSTPIARSLDEGRTTIERDITAHGHLLLTLSPATNRTVHPEVATTWEPHYPLESPLPVTLAEPNVLLLDRAELLASENMPAHHGTDILVLDNLIREELKIPRRTGRSVQPWADRSPTPVLATVRLRFAFDSDIDLDHIELGMENPEDATIHLDSTLVSNAPIGWWVDQSIVRIALPPMKAGRHDLVLTIPFTRKTELEAIYLLGDFGVRVDGAVARITVPVRALAWGDWTTQGLPFYGGNVTYHAKLPQASERAKLCIRQFSNPLISVASGSTPIGRIAFSPFELDLPSGVETLDITAFGNRANTFGPLHHVDEHLKWIGPAAWRTTGEKWTDAYRLKRMGILAAPILFTAQ